MNTISVLKTKVSAHFLFFALAMLLALIGCIRPTAEPVVKAKAVSAGGSHTCALTTVGDMKCWGFNYAGEIGDGTTTARSTPVYVTGLTSEVSAISAGNHTCALMGIGGVKCWGFNHYGQIGDGSNANHSTPANVTGLTSDVIAVSAGWLHTCALTTAGGVWCWGDNSYGQIGDGSNTNRNTPVNVTGLTSDVIAVWAGLNHTCALTAAGGVKCWGDYQYGQLGHDRYAEHNNPVDVVGLTSGVAAISAGGNHTCALTTAGGVKCWGDNRNGQLGIGTTITQMTPVNVVGLTSGVTAISAGGIHTCALTTAEGVKCWGGNTYGQLGDGTTTTRLTPVDVTGLASGVDAVSAGLGSHTCALMGIGGVKCWGDNSRGQLGDGSTNDSSVPVNVFAFIQ